MASKPVRIGRLAEIVGVPVWTLRRMADNGTIPFERSAGGHRVFQPAEVAASLERTNSTRSESIGTPRLEPAEAPVWTESYPLSGPDSLDEDKVWTQLSARVSLDGNAAAARILQHSLLEMINNAKDHSGGTRVDVAVWSTDDVLAFKITDNGDGAFAHLRKGLRLRDNYDAVLAMTKGKRTTWRARHSGEGIFFTSKINDIFRISANGTRWTVDNLRNDQAVGESPTTTGTVVYGQIATGTTRQISDVFGDYTEDFEFVRTKPAVKLNGLGLQFASRSEARRFLDGLEEFTEITLDFSGVTDIGQSWVDEVFRVWPREHPGKKLTPTGMNPAVEFMIRRGLARAAELEADDQ